MATPCAGTACGWFGVALNTAATFDVFRRLQVTNYGLFNILFESAPKGSNLIGVWVFCTHGQTAFPHLFRGNVLATSPGESKLKKLSMRSRRSENRTENRHFIPNPCHPYCYRRNSSRFATKTLGRFSATRACSVIRGCPLNTQKPTKSFTMQIHGCASCVSWAAFFVNHPVIGDPSCGNSETEGKVARVAASERGWRMSFKSVVNSSIAVKPLRGIRGLSSPKPMADQSQRVGDNAFHLIDSWKLVRRWRIRGYTRFAGNRCNDNRPMQNGPKVDQPR
jgi:hypothetical protein